MTKSLGVEERGWRSLVRTARNERGGPKAAPVFED
jgi:hypothetical protein